MNELSPDSQKKASHFIREIYKSHSRFGRFYASLTNGIHVDNEMEICFTGHGVTMCFRLAVEAIAHEENIPKLARYCAREVLTQAVLRELKES